MNKLRQIVHLHPDYTLKRDAILNCINQFNNTGETVLKGDRNSIKSFNLEGGEKINIKSFKRPNKFNAFVYKYLRKSKAKRSYQYAERLLQLKIATPFPIAYIEEFSGFGLQNSYYVSMHIDYDFDFRVLIHNPKYPDRVNILEQFTAFTFKLHENNVNFLDHSPGNTLIVKKSPDAYNFYLIDLNRMHFETMDFKKRMHNFRRLWLSKTMIKHMSKTYSGLYHKSYDETHKLMLKYSIAFQKKINSKKLRRSGRKMKFKTP
jgi:hypothetical protein